MRISEKQLTRLNSKKALKQFLAEEDTTITKVIRNVNYEYKLEELQVKLIHLQQWVERENKKIVFVFEGRDAAGKGGAIRRMTEHLNPRLFKVIALPKPTEEERSQWYFQRYVHHLPRDGEMVFFDRSWYNRAVVEPVNGFCTQKEYEIFMNQVNDFERMIIESGTLMMKFYFSITKNEQKKRFDEIIASPVKKWKFSNVDSRANELWDEYTVYKEKMFEKTNTEIAPWAIISANRKSKARLEVINKVLETIPYVHETEDGLEAWIENEKKTILPSHT